MKKYKLKLVNNCDLKYVLHFLIKNIKSKHVMFKLFKVYYDILYSLFSYHLHYVLGFK